MGMAYDRRGADGKIVSQVGVAIDPKTGIPGLDEPGHVADEKPVQIVAPVHGVDCLDTGNVMGQDDGVDSVLILPDRHGKKTGVYENGTENIRVCKCTLFGNPPDLHAQ